MCDSAKAPMRVNDQMPLRVILAPIGRIGCFYPLLDH
jgi:hypothetical protein